MPQTLIPRPRARLAMAGLAAAVLAAGCGSSSGGNSNADPASVVPGSAPIYVSVVVKPEGDQKAQLEAVLKKVLQTDDPGAKIEKLFNDATKKHDVNYSDDVKPWLGKRVGLFFTSFRNNGDDTQGAAVVPTSDKDKALDTIRKGDKNVKKRSYRDVDYQVSGDGDASAAVGDFVVAGDESGVKAVIDTSKDSGKAITKEADFQKATSAAGGTDKLATMYLDLGGLIDSLVRDGSVDRNSALALRQALSTANATDIGLSANATADGFTLDFAALGGKSSSATTGKGDGPAALAGVPGDSWLAVGIGDLGGDISKALDQVGQLSALGGADIDTVFEQLRQQSGLDIRKDVIDWMGDAAVFVRGTSIGDIGGGLIVKSKDPAATARGIKRIAKLLRRQGQTVSAVSGVSGVDTGVELKVNGLEVFLVSSGSKFVAAVGRSSLEMALKGTETLGDSPGFQRASSQLGSGIRPSVFFAMSPLLQLLESTGLGSNPGYQSARPYLRAFSTVVAGGKQEAGVAKGRVVIAVR